MLQCSRPGLLHIEKRAQTLQPVTLELACTLPRYGASDCPVHIPEMQGWDSKFPRNSAQLNSSSNLRARGGQTLECLQARRSADPQASTQASDLGVNMAKAKSVTPQSKPAVAAKKNVKAKQAAIKAETKKAAPKKVCAQQALRACLYLHVRPDVQHRITFASSCRPTPAARRNPQAMKRTLPSKPMGRPPQQQQRFVLFCFTIQRNRSTVSGDSRPRPSILLR